MQSLLIHFHEYLLIFSCNMYSGLENILQSLPTWSSLSIVPPTTHTQIISFYFPFKK